MDSDLVQIDEFGRIDDIHRKPHRLDAICRNLTAPGIFVAEPDALNYLPDVVSGVTVSDFIVCLIDAMQTILAYRTTEYVEICRSNQQYRRIVEDLRFGRPQVRGGRTLQPAMFIDRDGTLNRDVGHLYHPDQIELLPDAAAAVRALNRAGVLAVVVTNQAVLARGLCSFAELRQIHGRLELALGAEGAYLDGIYFCPHYPVRGYPGEVASLKVECGCRKPKPGLVIAACRQLPIDLRRSAVVGDSARDIELADQLNLASYWISPPTKQYRRGTTKVASLHEAVSHWLDCGENHVLNGQGRQTY